MEVVHCAVAALLATRAGGMRRIRAKVVLDRLAAGVPGALAARLLAEG